MKILFCFITLLFLAAGKQQCSSKKATSGAAAYRGRLEIKGICMNYTIKVIGGPVDTSLLATAWTDETNGKVYTNVFALGNPCSFPATIEQGDEFSFSIDTAKRQHCNMCLAYYPKPQKQLSIVVTGK